MRQSPVWTPIGGLVSVPIDTQGLFLTESFYWDLNERTRAFTDRVKGKMASYPNMTNAGCYAGSLHFLKAVADVGRLRPSGTARR
jgi:hypothetical protein